MTENVAILMVGSPFCGKTTYISSNFSHYTSIESDKTTIEQLFDFIQDCIITSKNFVIDGCNESLLRRRFILDSINSTAMQYPDKNYKIICHYIIATQSLLKEAISEKIHNDLAKSHLLDRINRYDTYLDVPQIGEGFTSLSTHQYAFKKTLNKAIFFDLDGTVRYSKGEKGFPLKADDIVIYDDVCNVLLEFYKKGYKLIGVSNQSAISKGIISEETVQDLMIETLCKINVPIDEIIYCPHQADDNCTCRKPAVAMATRSALKYNLDLKNCIMIGDLESDKEFAKNAGMQYHDRNKFYGEKYLEDCKLLN